MKNRLCVAWRELVGGWIVTNTKRLRECCCNITNNPREIGADIKATQIH